MKDMKKVHIESFKIYLKKPFQTYFIFPIALYSPMSRFLFPIPHVIVHLWTKSTSAILQLYGHFETLKMQPPFLLFL